MREIGSEFWLDCDPSLIRLAKDEKANETKRARGDNEAKEAHESKRAKGDNKVKEARETKEIKGVKGDKKVQSTLAMGRFLNIGKDRKLLFSGRTAIDYVLQDIDKHIKRVYMPSYSCESMLQPFFSRGISVEYYDVIMDDSGLRYSIDTGKTTDIFFAMSYFGYDISNMDFYIKEFKKRDVLVIEDITHRLLSEKNHCPKSDYLIASLRKWFPLLSGGIAIKMGDRLKNIDLKYPRNGFIDKRQRAMGLKAKYLAQESDGDEDLKAQFLKLYSESNKDISHNYKNLKMDKASKDLLKEIDLGDVIKKRKENASLLHKHLATTKGITPLFREIDYGGDCPLFVPTRVGKNLRPKLADFLKLHKIYCPVHWPLHPGLDLNDSTRKIYNEELSLICDQRYNRNDMDRLIEVLKEFFKQNE